MASNLNDSVNDSDKKSSSTSGKPTEVTDNDLGNVKDGTSINGDNGIPSSTVDNSKIAGGNIPESTVYPNSPVISYMSMQQPSRGYYAYQQNGTTPNSPAITTPTGAYDMQGLMYPQTAGLGSNVMTRQHFSNIVPPAPSLSPIVTTGNSGVEETGNVSVGLVAPPSPLFPGPTMSFLASNTERIESSAPNSMVAPNSPSLQYIPGHPPSPAISAYTNVYAGYGSTTNPQNSPDNRPSWNDRPAHQQHLYQNTGSSLHLQTPSLPIQLPGAQMQNRRTTSFDEMLPPPAMVESSQDTYAVSMAGNTSWGFNGLDPYGQIPHGQQSFRQRPMGGRPEQSSLPPNIQSFYPATTPGPPIQTTHHNKGPDGANLFIFHIPNHFTNMDMWNLFCHYGNLLSVRIMVEKDTGRSRGFGFVSYDSPDAAAMAIKELNGFVVGNKRLKVQHKQIRQSENPISNQHRNVQGPTATFTNGQHHANNLGSHPEHDPMIGESWMRGPHPSNGVKDSSMVASEESFLVTNPDQRSIAHDTKPHELNNLNSGTEQNGFANLSQMREALPTMEK